MCKRQQLQRITNRTSGFSLLELMVSVSLIGILLAVGIPALGEFTLKSRVDNEISELRRLVLAARNTAVNTGQFVTLCPLSGTTCQINNWQNQLSVFTNAVNTLADANTFNNATEILVKTKSATAAGDAIQSTQGQIVFSPTGGLASPGPVRLTYCPSGRTDLSRAVIINISGSSFATSDIDGDGEDEDRNGNAVGCI
ncbi:GspH/FimT family pseudopilin [Thalassotalea ganghwensis]